jgi:hypothetical protein
MSGKPSALLLLLKTTTERFHRGSSESIGLTYTPLGKSLVLLKGSWGRYALGVIAPPSLALIEKALHSR